jgi:hypothetical protein
MKQLVILIITCFWGCDKENISTSQDSVQILWRKQLGPVLYDQIAQDPAIYKNSIIFGYQTGQYSGYYFLDKNKGALLKDLKNERSFEPTSTLNKEIYYSNFGSIEFRTINLETYEIRNHKLPIEVQSSYGVIPKDDFVYLPFFPLGEKNKIRWKRATNIAPYFWNDFYTITFKDEQDIFGSFSSPMLTHKNTSKEEIVYFVSLKAYKQASKKSKYKVTAFNSTRKETIWETEEFEVENEDGNITGRNLLLIENQLIVPLGGTQLMSFDIRDGKNQWKAITTDMTFTNYIAHKGKISFLNGVGVLYMIETSSGKIISKREGFVGNTKNWAFHNGIMYFTTASNKLFGVDAETHEIKIELSSPNKANCSFCGFFLASPVVDPETNRLYISDRKEVICYQLPK